MVVVSGTWAKNVVSFPINGELITTAKMAARAVLICRPNSHPFQERTLSLDQPVKIGRSVARARAVPNNAIFDCKVLSRNHALLWYENGKFYLQDTKSSNGTFVNNQRLSKGAEESPPREVCSGDIVQFGVDVMENARKVTHGCIVATVKLYLPDGKEAKASPSTSVVSSVGMVPLEDLYQLNQYLQEALQREQMLENKLATLQQLVESTRQASELAWRALIDEDRLLSRVEILENQLQISSKSFGEDKLRDELRKLQEDKSQYQGTAKESLQKVLQEKLDALQKLQALELSLSNSENECVHLKKLCEQGQQDLQDLAQKFSVQLQKVEDLTTKLEDSEEQNKETSEKLEQEKHELQNRLEEQNELAQALQLRLDALQADGDLTQQKMADLQSHLHLLKSNEENEGDTKEGLDNINIGGTTDSPINVILERIDPSMLDNVKEEMEDLRYKLKSCEDELQDSRALVSELHRQKDLVELELHDAVQKISEVKVHLEDMRNEEDLSQEKSVNLQERIVDIGVELDLVSENDTNKDIEDTSQNNASGQITRLKAERSKLQELLAEVRAKKLATEEQKEIYEQELNCLNMKVKKTTEEANLLKQQFSTAVIQMNTKNQAVQDLQNKIQRLEASSGENIARLTQMQDKLREEVQRANKHAAEADTLRKQLMEAQQNAKQNRNESEQMKDRLKAFHSQVELETKKHAEMESSKNAGSHRSSPGDNKQDEELQVLRDQCRSFEDEVKTLRTERSQWTDQSRQLEEAKKSELELKQRLVQIRTDGEEDTLPLPDEVPRDANYENTIQEELLEVKTNYVQLTEAKEKVENELAEYKRKNPEMASRSLEVQKYFPLMMAFAILFIGLVLGIVHKYSQSSPNDEHCQRCNCDEEK